MKIDYFKDFSHEVNRALEFKVYGNSTGIPIIVFPTRGGRFYDFENFGMIESVRDYIEDGKIQVFTLDSIDNETWCGKNSEHERMCLHECFFNYIIEELVPRIAEINDSKVLPILAGCDLGGGHAMNFFLRRPDLFSGVISMSGIYNAEFFFPSYCDELTYKNSPLAYLYNMTRDHEYIPIYKEKVIIASTGQGANEDPCVYDTHALKQAFLKLNIDNAFVDFWGSDVDHDWVWWRREFPYFVQKMLDEIK